MRPRLAALVFALCFAAGTVARADEQSELDKGRNAYLARQYDEADARFRVMLDPKTGKLHDPALVSQAYMYWGAVKIAKKLPAEADELFEQLLLKNPQYEPDPLSFPTSVLNAFSDTRSRIRERLNAQAKESARKEAERRAHEEEDKQRQIARIRVLERLAGEERVTYVHSRILAFVPFGAGQFQNGNTGLGWFFLGAESLFVAVGTIAIPFYYYEKNAFINTYDDPSSISQTATAQAHFDRARTWGFINTLSYGGFLVTAAAGIIEANVRYQPEVTVIKPRAVPPTISLVPSAGAHGAGLGLKISF